MCPPTVAERHDHPLVTTPFNRCSPLPPPAVRGDELASPRSLLRHEALARRVLARLATSRRLWGLLSAVEKATKGEFYVFGGTLRRTLIDTDPGCDLDIMVPNDDNRVFDCLAQAGITHSLNRRGHRRYDFNGLQLDVNQPQEWQANFADVPDVLKFFDLRINSLALHFGSRTVLDPLRALALPFQEEPGINWRRWRAMPPLELTILVIRLHRILHESPGLFLTAQDGTALQNVVLPQCDSVDWHLVRDRFPGTKADFVREFKATVALRTIPLVRASLAAR